MVENLLLQVLKIGAVLLSVNWSSWKALAAASSLTSISVTPLNIAPYSAASTTETNFYGSGNWTLTSAPYGLNWDNIRSDSSGKYLVASASYSGVFISSDFGVTWTETLNSSLYRWYPLSISSDGQQIIAVAMGFAGYRSQDYGLTWNVLPNLNAMEVTSIACNAGGNICIYCQYGVGISVSLDNGDSWSPTSASPSNWVALASNGDGSHFIAASNFQGIFLSFDTGSDWQLATGLQASLDWVAVTNDQSGKYLAALAKGYPPFISNDYGSTWSTASMTASSSSAPSTLSYVAMHMDSSGQQLVVVSNAVTDPIYISQDAGSTWSILTPGGAATSQSWYGIASDSTGQYLAAVSAHGGVYTYTLPVPNVCPAGKGRDGYICVACGCEKYNNGNSLYCSECPDDAVSYYPYATCKQVCSYPYIVTVDNADTCLASADGNPVYQCVHLILRTPLWLLLLLIVFTVVCLCVNLYTIHRKILVKLPSQSALRALKNTASNPNFTETRQSTPVSSTTTPSSSNLSLSRSLHSQSAKAFEAAYDCSFYLRVAFRTAVPALDMTTDLLYILTSEFANTTIFVLCILAFLHPIVFMGRDFWRLKDTPKAMPHFYVLPIPGCIWHIFQNVDDFFKLMVFGLLCLPFVLINMVTWLPMLILMFLLYSNKLFAFTMYSKTWYACWNGSILSSSQEPTSTPPSMESESATHDTMPAVDVEFFNEQSLFCMLLQSIPQFCLQLYNVYMLDQLTPLALISLTMSMVAALNIFYRIVYYRLLLKMDLKDVPNVLLELNQIVSDQPSSKPTDATNNNEENETDEAIITNPMTISDRHNNQKNHQDDIANINNSHLQRPVQRTSFVDTLRHTFGYATQPKTVSEVDMTVFRMNQKNRDGWDSDDVDAETQALLVEQLYQRWQSQWQEEKEQWKQEILNSLVQEQQQHHQVIHVDNNQTAQPPLDLEGQVALEVEKQLQRLGVIPKK